MVDVWQLLCSVFGFMNLYKWWRRRLSMVALLFLFLLGFVSFRIGFRCNNNWLTCIFVQIIIPDFIALLLWIIIFICSCNEIAVFVTHSIQEIAPYLVYRPTLNATLLPLSNAIFTNWAKLLRVNPERYWEEFKVDETSIYGCKVKLKKDSTTVGATKNTYAFVNGVDVWIVSMRKHNCYGDSTATTINVIDVTFSFSLI